jgi:hypothetical protein
MGARNRVGIGLSYSPPGYIAWRNWFHEIDSRASEVKNSVSGSVLGMRIRIHEPGNYSNINKETRFPAFQTGLHLSRYVTLKPSTSTTNTSKQEMLTGMLAFPASFFFLSRSGRVRFSKVESTDPIESGSKTLSLHVAFLRSIPLGSKITSWSFPLTQSIINARNQEKSFI